MATDSLRAQGLCVEKLYPNTWLFFYLYGAIGVEWQDEGLPPPCYLLHSNAGATIGWQIKGFPGTIKAREYFNDIIARVVITFADYRPQRVQRPDKSLDADAHVNATVAYDLKQFGNLKSLYWRGQKAEKFALVKAGEQDKIFWAIKLYVEARIKQQGEGTPVIYQELEAWAFETFWIDERRAKDKSTLRAKCRSVWNWYDARGWTIPKKESQMTRSERARANAKLKAIRAENAVRSAVQSLKFLNERISIRKVAEYAQVSKSTAEKYLRKLREEGLI